MKRTADEVGRTDSQQKQLTSGQIAQIKAFVEDKGIMFPDVQLEIIDHIASRIEELIRTNPELTFAAAMDIPDAEFGVKGFKAFEAGMISAMRKKYFRLFYITFFSWFNWKYLPLIAGLVYLLYRLYVILNLPELFIVGGCFLLFIGISLNARSLSIKYKKNKKFYKKLLTMRVAGRYVSILNVWHTIWVYCFLFGDAYEKVNLNTAGIVFGSVIVLIILLFLTIKKMLRVSIEACEQLNEQYQLLKN